MTAIFCRLDFNLAALNTFYDGKNMLLVTSCWKFRGLGGELLLSGKINGQIVAQMIKQTNERTNKRTYE